MRHRMTASCSENTRKCADFRATCSLLQYLKSLSAVINRHLNRHLGNPAVKTLPDGPLVDHQRVLECEDR